MERFGPAAGHFVPGIEDLVEIGHGGAGVVYRGRQPELARDVAVKVLWSRGAPEADLARWRREVTAMARLSNHPNIVAVYDGGTTADGLPYLVMPYVPGGTLGDRLRAQGPLPADEVVAIGRKLTAALGAAHAAGVLHRDVKPDNVLLSPYGEPQLADFGIARLLDATATAARAVHATVAYAAPEVLTGQPATETSDVYGLAATLHACLTGTPPFAARDGEPLVALAARITADAPPELRAHGVPEDLAALVDQAMAKDRGDRIATASELGRRLEQVVVADRGDAPTDRDQPAPTTARPGPYPAWKPPRASASTLSRPPARHRVTGPVLAAVGMVVLGALVAMALAGAGNEGGDGDDPTVAADTATTAPPDDVTATTADMGSVALAYFELIGRGELHGAYAMTSPGFQAAQPFDGYADFWGGFNSVLVEGSPIVDGHALTATVNLRLDGGRETYTLSFIPADVGTLLIDGPRPR